ncbi:MAG: imidazoleglycerol-phosphate dehydratase HisB [Acidimicrobiales bacterium]
MSDAALRPSPPSPAPPSAAPPSPAPPSAGPARRAVRYRHTAETAIDCTLALDGSATPDVDTGLPFFDHMVAQLGRHGGMDLSLRAKGDLEVDAHHSVEDVGIVLGEALAEALGDKAGIRRFASVSLPLDEALVEAALDLSGRSYLYYEVAFPPDALPLGSPAFEPQLAEEFWRAFVTAAGITLHLRLVRGRNTHHILEASFKAVARALRDAVRVEGARIPSTKGVLA